tara:strand:- start:611 stop:1264 length:654 start_codon:yes stop_codon:yes gene_type:complete
MNSDCVICLEPLEDGSTKTLECGHIYCTVCIDEWIQVNKHKPQWECPLCRFTNVVCVNEYTSDDRILSNARDIMHSMEVIKFRGDRGFIRVITCIDVIVSTFYLTDGYAFICAICSAYGYFGATKLNVGCLNCFSVFTLVNILIKVHNVVTFANALSQHKSENTEDAIQIHNGYVYIIFSGMCLLFQVYIIHVICRMTSMMIEYRERLSAHFANDCV